MTPKPMKWKKATPEESRGFSNNSWPLLDDLIERKRSAPPPEKDEVLQDAFFQLIEAAFPNASE